MVTVLFARPAADRPTSCFRSSDGRAVLIVFENMATGDVVLRWRGDGRIRRVKLEHQNNVGRWRSQIEPSREFAPSISDVTWTGHSQQ